VRVVVPYVGAAHPLTEESVITFSPEAEFYGVAVDDGYWFLLDEFWRAGEDFAVIEHDIEIRADVLPAFEACRSPWCTFGYPTYDDFQGNPSRATLSLGCVRFRSELMRLGPDLFDTFNSRHWSRLDVEIAVRLHLPPFRAQRCLHEPDVAHHHVYAPEYHAPRARREG